MGNSISNIGHRGQESSVPGDIKGGSHEWEPRPGVELTDIELAEEMTEPYNDDNDETNRKSQDRRDPRPSASYTPPVSNSPSNVEPLRFMGV